MADLDKVIKGLEHCMGDQPCEECPYEKGCDKELMGDALELLKAQEPKNLNLAQDVSGIYAVCPRCGEKIHTLLAEKMKLEFPMPKFCKYCGQEVKWDADS